MITREKVLLILDYFPATGTFARKYGVKGHRAGPTGHLQNGYVRIAINGEFYRAHRLVWFLETGEWPKEIDHINRNRSDNRFCNLRDVSRACNMHNRGAQINSKSGVKGISWSAERKRWVFQIKVGERKIYSRHKTFTAAVFAQRLASEQLLRRM